jgi:hypothetical protein
VIERRTLDSKIYAVILVAVALLVVVLVKFWLPRDTVFSASAVSATSNIGVYWDKNCTKRVDSIDWGVLSPGQTKKVLVYVRNEANDSTILVLTTSNWSPAKASECLSFSWYSQSEKIGAGKVINVSQSLFVSPSTVGISNFSFGITFEGRKYYQGDANKDGVVDLFDAVIVALAYNSKPGDPNWNAIADLDKNGVIDVFDMTTVGKDFGKT